jgi:ABC-type phosphate transport system permease subunit
MSSNNTAGAGPPRGTGLPGAPVNLGRRPRPGETAIKAVLFVSAMLSVAITVGILVALVEPVVHFFAEVPFGEFFSFDEGQRFAVFPLITATLMTTAIALLVAVPLGLGAAMYLSEYASRRARKYLKPTVELLAGVPSVVYGFFAVMFVTPTLLQDFLGLGVGFTNALAAGLVLGVMIIPTVASLAEDAFSAVPQALRQGSYAMGANRMQTTLRVVLPAALSGVGGRGDHDRGARGRVAEELQPQPPRGHADHDGLHGDHGGR